MESKIRKYMRRMFTVLTAILFLAAVHAQRLVLPGDHPDPSAVKIGDSWWATATTSNWFPAFPLLQSKDLVRWEQRGYVFNQLPAWADYYFWAPEISYDNGKVYVYYAAHKKGGNLCVGVASADRPEGPYRDHGPLMCEAAGSIDAFPMRDENGKLFLIWKEDGNSIRQPTVIWAMEMNEERTALIGEKKELFRNDLGWEHNLVEGVSIKKHDGWYHAFYAAAGCCGPGCSYAVGLARSRSLLGPWEKKKEPLMTGNNEWVCPGHGTPVEKDGRLYFLYHAYNKKTHQYTGREGLLAEYRTTADGWIDFIRDSTAAAAPFASVLDKFRNRNLSGNWQWNVFQQPQVRTAPGGAFLGQRTPGGNYDAYAEVHARKSDAAAGIALIGDEKNLISMVVEGSWIRVLQVKDGVEQELGRENIGTHKKVHLSMQVRNGKDVVFLYSTNGQDYKTMQTTFINGAYLPPWDRALRAGLVSAGATDQVAVFDRFELRPV
jgi:xylan 1,4-beta-xylosidase